MAILDRRYGLQHDWLEVGGPACVLMAYSDDASSRAFDRRYEYEGAMPTLDGLPRNVQQYVVPLAVYADKHTTYHSLAEPTVEEQLAGTKPQSQFGRALSELRVELIAAHSPQANGRGERLFQAFQDRVINEMRLARVATLGRPSTSWGDTCFATTSGLPCRRRTPPNCIGRGRRPWS